LDASSRLTEVAENGLNSGSGTPGILSFKSSGFVVPDPEFEMTQILG
jgi:hypothetical protein